MAREFWLSEARLSEMSPYPSSSISKKILYILNIGAMLSLMRVFTLILMFFTVFCSFSTVADVSCRASYEHQNLLSGADTVCKKHTQEANRESEQTGNPVCADCHHHSCASHALYPQSFSSVIFNHFVTKTVLSAQVIHKDQYLFFLLRPPKSLV